MSLRNIRARAWEDGWSVRGFMQYASLSCVRWGMMECTSIGCGWACARVWGQCARVEGFSSLFPVLMMRLIICSASFRLPQAHVHTRARTYTHACVTSLRQQTQQHLFGHKLRLVREGERRGERRGSRCVRVHSRFGVKRAVKLCFSGTSPPGGETSVPPSQGSGMGKN